jgi:hypothetical protein
MELAKIGGRFSERPPLPVLVDYVGWEKSAAFKWDWVLVEVMVFEKEC